MDKSIDVQVESESEVIHKDIKVEAKVRKKKIAKLPFKQLHDNQLWTGTAASEIKRAADTYLNNVGPGQYNLPPIFGACDSTRKNHPSLPFGSKTKPTLEKPFLKELY